MNVNINLTEEQLEQIKEEIRKDILKELKNPNSLIDKEVVVIENHDNGGYRSNNIKYISKAYNKSVKIVHKEKEYEDLYITNFFIPEFIDIKNDYIHYGFLKVSRADFKIVME